MRNIAIISIHKDKYSETFIHNHVKLLPGTIYFLFGGYLPDKCSSDRGLTFQNINEVSRPGFLSIITTGFKNKKDKLASSIEQYLLKNNIELILCEYGPSGVEMMPIARKLNIPLIVHFHGFDAYRSDVLDFYKHDYQALFTTARKVIAASKHMCRQLMKLGCSGPKIHYLPYGINTDIFSFSARERTELLFVACGRFVGKKAPQLTIRAFERVFQKFPGARLIMIGDGELLDECRQLTRQLGMENALEFTGALAQESIAKLFAKSFAFLQHSITSSNNDSEGTPLTIMEAMSSGLPVVSTKHAGITDIITNDTLGFLVEENDYLEMSEKMLYLVNNPQMAMAMGKTASAHITANYNLNAYTTKLAHLINETANAK